MKVFAYQAGVAKVDYSYLNTPPGGDSGTDTATSRKGRKGRKGR